jgi:predicted nuclease of predicted toxin-antitoxin system
VKLLFDQNISYRVIKKISPLYPDAQQIRALGLENSTDIQIWEYAKKSDYSIVTFDADYFDIASLKGHPPKIIWLRVGNTTTDNLARLFIDKYNQIEDFISNPDNKNLACLEIE